MVQLDIIALHQYMEEWEMVCVIREIVDYGTKPPKEISRPITKDF